MSVYILYGMIEVDFTVQYIVPFEGCWLNQSYWCE